MMLSDIDKRPTRTNRGIIIMAAAISAIRKNAAAAGNTAGHDTGHELLAKLPDAELREVDIELGMLLTG
jgi:hypothetical protein